MNYMLYCTAFLSMLATTSAMARTYHTNDSEILSHSNQDGPIRSLMPGGPAIDAAKDLHKIPEIIVHWVPPLDPSTGSSIVTDWTEPSDAALLFFEILPPDTSAFTADDATMLTVRTLGPSTAHAFKAKGVGPLSVPSPGVLPLALCALLGVGRRRRP